MSDDRDEPLIISPETIAELEVIAERDQKAGGPPWEVADHPDHQLPGGWHRNFGTNTDPVDEGGN